MKLQKFNQFGSKLVLMSVVILVASCKPTEESKSEVTAATNTPPAIITATATNAPASTNAPLIIAPTKAREYVGKQVTVRGVVSDVHVTTKGDVFLNFGGKFPNTIFTAACFKNTIPTDQLTALKGKTISVSGKIKDYNGQVEIVLESPDQISQ